MNNGLTTKNRVALEAADGYVAEARAEQALATLASIIIVSYNSRGHLERCLPSVFATIALRCEVIVVDNASTDGSADWVATHFPWVRLIRSATNDGFAAGNNRGAAEAAGRWFKYNEFALVSRKPPSARPAR